MGGAAPAWRWTCPAPAGASCLHIVAGGIIPHDEGCLDLLNELCTKPIAPDGFAFVFGIISVIHDVADSIAAIVWMRVLSPLTAAVWAASFNFVAAFTPWTAVATMIGKGMIDARSSRPT